MNVNNIIIRPIITEKSINESGSGKFTFAVARYATKTDIKTAVTKVFNAKVTSVATRLVKGKTKRVGARRTEIREAAWKRAIIKLEKGSNIDLFNLGREEKKPADAKTKAGKEEKKGKAKK